MSAHELLASHPLPCPDRLQIDDVIPCDVCPPRWISVSLVTARSVLGTNLETELWTLRGVYFTSRNCTIELAAAKEAENTMQDYLT